VADKVKMGRILVISAVITGIKQDLEAGNRNDVDSMLYDLVDCTTEMEHGEIFVEFLKKKGIMESE